MDTDDIINIGVTMVKAKELKNMDMPLLGKNDAYAKVKIKQQEYKTSVKRNAGSQCTWEETFHLRLEKGDKIEIEVWDEDLLRDDFIGSVSIPSDVIFSEGSIEGWYQLYQGHKQSGKIFLKIHYLP
ncbi:hypothetical protein K502DRAFT_332303 [Neoconidiobolus thromboides FSU 785]|nr:hypothetical protein K502DRAFT_296231 [Neoconidiobolus thromboides FSU 785]KAI9292487.1 hypothetical protein K502DRAFT_332303 [Neoconidiobolus thromboides FSU 785]